MNSLANILFSAWQLVIKRSLAHWKLLSSVITGVVLSSAVMAGTVIYFDALRELALKSALNEHVQTKIDLTLKGERGPLTREEFVLVKSSVAQVIQRDIGWIISKENTAVKSPTFFLSYPEQETAPGKDNLRTYFASIPSFTDNIELLPGGRLPSEEQIKRTKDTLVVEAMIPSEAASRFSVNVGDSLIASPPWDSKVGVVEVIISGIFERNAPDSDYWHIEREFLGASLGSGFKVVPFHLSEALFLDVLGPSFPNMDGIYAWHLTIDRDRIKATNAESVLKNVRSTNVALGQLLSGYKQTTVIDQSLSEYDRRLFFNKLPMFIVLILISVVVLYYVVTLSSLTVEERAGEVALLRSRGATPRQIVSVFAIEGATIAALSALVAPLIAATTVSLLGFTPAFSDLSNGNALDVTISQGAYSMSAIGGLLSFVALLIPAVQASRIGVTRHRQKSARPEEQPAFQRYYIDVMLLGLGILLFRQLSEQGSVVATNLFGELAANQLLLALPGLILLASAMVLLRLFPFIMNLSSKILSPLLPAGLVMGIWQLARNPTHHARLSLLLILTAGLGIFAASFGATLERSFEERVLYSTGSDIRIDGIAPVFNPRARSPRRGWWSRRNLPTPTATPYPAERPTLEEAYEGVVGVENVSPILKSTGNILTKIGGEQYVMFALDGRTFENVAWIREDFAEQPFADLIGLLSNEEQNSGLLIPKGSTTLSVTLKSDRRRPAIRLSARVKDNKGRYVTYNMGSLESAEWAVYNGDLTGNSHQELQPDGPLKLVSLRIHDSGANSGGSAKLQAGTILIDEIWVSDSDGTKSVLEGFKDLDDWDILVTEPNAVTDVLSISTNSRDGSSRSALFTWSEGTSLTTRGIFHGSSMSPIPVIASSSFTDVSDHELGDQLEVSVAGYRVPVRIEGRMELFPTLQGSEKLFLLADLDTLIHYVNLGALDKELVPNGVWISATEDADNVELLSRVSSIDAYQSLLIRDRASKLEESNIDPLVQAGWRSLLFIAFGTVLLLSCFGFLVHAYVSFQNRQIQFALLRTVGFSMRQLMTMVWLEQALVITLGMALGIWMGGRLGATIMPFLGNDDWGREVEPPFIMQADWGSLMITYGIMVFVFLVISLGILWMIRRVSMTKLLRMGEQQ
jgi:ABC-type antimicrobial peptide transport system permease subunit